MYAAIVLAKLVKEHDAPPIDIHFGKGIRTRLILWELKVYKNIGYDINFEDYVKKVSDNKNEKFIVESNNKTIPNFLIYKNNILTDFNDNIEAFKIVGEFLDKTILKPNNISYPISRSYFFNSIK